jgi:hypothetical protein
MAIRKTRNTTLQTTETASSRYLLPDEDLDEFTRFSDAILKELAPVGVYQLHLATNLVQIEWDILRHRRLVAAVLRTEFRRQAGGVAEKGDPGLVSTAFAMKTELHLGRSLLAQEAEGDAILTQTGVLRSEITAAAFLSRSETVAYHEGRIADLERRRRQLLADYDRLRARKSVPDDADDAVEVI